MTKEQEDALFGFLKGLSIANDDHDAYDALLAAFGRTEPLPTTRQAYYDAGSVPPTVAEAVAEPVAVEPVTANAAFTADASAAIDAPEETDPGVA